MLDDRVLTQLLSTFAQVLPHQILGERKHGQHHVFGDLPTFDAFDRLRYGVPDAAHVQAMLIAWQLAIGYAKVELEVLAQHLNQRRVEARLVLVQHECKS